MKKKKSNFYYVMKLNGGYGGYEVFVDQPGRVQDADAALKNKPTYRPYCGDPVIYKGLSFIYATEICRLANDGVVDVSLPEKTKKPTKTKSQMELDL